jgi:ataxin-3
MHSLKCRDTQSQTTAMVFHERQEGALCAQHALNSVLQGAYFTAVDLAELARSLDNLERERLAGGDYSSPDYLRAMQADSQNMDDSGFFSVQVISEALRMWDLTIDPIKSQACTEARKAPELENAFVCNFEDHWFALRKIDGVWYNLDSNLPAPAELSPLYLGLLLSQLEQAGYSVFVVKGSLPAPLNDSGSSMAAEAEDPGMSSAIARSL